MKTCKHCKQSRKNSQFYEGRAKCKICREEYLTSYRLANREKILKRKNIWKKKNPDKVKSASLMSDYGINLNEYNNLLLKQKYCCAICEANQATLTLALAVDHCHKTNKIRGLLCQRCNRAIGLFNDDAKYLKAAIAYLEGL